MVALPGTIAARWPWRADAADEEQLRIAMFGRCIRSQSASMLSKPGL
jgi:hypothetical protein